MYINRMTISFRILGNHDKKLIKNQILRSVECNGSEITFCMDFTACHREGGLNYAIQSARKTISYGFQHS